MVPWLAPTARSTNRSTIWLVLAGCGTTSMICCESWQLLKMICELHEPGRLVTAAAQIKFSSCWHAVRSADSAIGRYHKALPGHDDRVLTALAHVFRRSWLLLQSLRRHNVPCVQTIASDQMDTPVLGSRAGTTISHRRMCMQLADAAVSARFWSQLQINGRYFQRRVAPLSRSGELVGVINRTHR